MDAMKNYIWGTPIKTYLNLAEPPQRLLFVAHKF